jgi:hypothetical protein
MRASTAVIALLCAVAAVGGDAVAQRLPGGLASLPPALGNRLDPVLDPVLDLPARVLRHARIEDLLHRERRRLDVDPRGNPVLRGEYLLLSSDAATLDAVRAAGFDTVPDHEADDLGVDIVVLRDRQARSAARAMRDLREAAPDADFAYQHLYLPAGTADGAPSTAVASASHARVGLVDGGVAAGLAGLSRVDIRRFGCEGRIVGDAHAAAVASRLVGGTRDTLYAADLWCGDRLGRATLGLVQALAWMAREKVPVVNISLVGPDNPVLSRAITALVARGHVVIAAVGNDGPAAPPLYPAAYPGVIGVGAVDDRLRVLPESAAGPQVDFSAGGIVDPRTRGTSFAAPVVARVAADLISEPRPGASAEVERALAIAARDLGAPGRDARYGMGYVAGF